MSRILIQMAARGGLSTGRLGVGLAYAFKVE
jgi:hypothetical protein